MNKPSKKGSILWIILTIISLLSVGGLLFLMLEERNKRVDAEEELLVLAGAKKAVETKLDQAQRELIKVKDQAKLLEQKIVQERQTYQSALEELAKKDAEVSDLENRLSKERKQRLNLANNLTKLRRDYDKLSERLKQAKTKTEGLREELAKSPERSGVELKKIIVKPKKKELSGKVLVVNREFHFVVIDLGEKQGLKIGDEFIIYQGAEGIATAKVEKVYELMSTASILSGSQEHMISEGSPIKSF